MALPPPVYDLTVLLDPSFEEVARTKILADAEELIAQHGEIVGSQDWGTRKLAYEIEKQPEADFHLIQFLGTAELLSELDRTLRITDGVVRHRIIKLRPGTPPVTDDTPFPAAEPMSIGAGDDRDRDRDRDRER